MVAQIDDLLAEINTIFSAFVKSACFSAKLTDLLKELCTALQTLATKLTPIIVDGIVDIVKAVFCQIQTFFVCLTTFDVKTQMDLPNIDQHLANLTKSIYDCANHIQNPAKAIPMIEAIMDEARVIFKLVKAGVERAINDNRLCQNGVICLSFGIGAAGGGMVGSIFSAIAAGAAVGGVAFGFSAYALTVIPQQRNQNNIRFEAKKRALELASALIKTRSLARQIQNTLPNNPANANYHSELNTFIKELKELQTEVEMYNPC